MIVATTGFLLLLSTLNCYSDNDWLLFGVYGIKIRGIDYSKN